MRATGRPGNPGSTPRQLLVAVEGEAAGEAEVARLRAELTTSGYELVDPPIERALGRPPSPRLLLVVPVASDRDAGKAVQAALRGFSVMTIARGDRALIDSLYEDLRRFGRPVVRSIAAEQPGSAVGTEAHQLLDLLASGLTLGEAAATLHLSRRTADRRLAAARRALGAATTVEAMARARSKPAG